MTLPLIYYLQPHLTMPSAGYLRNKSPITFSPLTFDYSTKLS